MRVKQIVSFVPLPMANIRLVYSRITSSRLTTAFFLLSFLHFLLQVSFQAWAFQINASAGAFLSDILTAGNLAPQSVFAVLAPLSSDGQSGGELRLCSTQDIEAHENIYECPVVWKGRSSLFSNGSAVTYAASTPPSTSVSSSLPTDAPTPGTAASAGPTLGPGATTPKEDIFVVGVGQGDEDDSEIYDDEDEDDSSDKRALAVRDHNLAKVARLSLWRRAIPVEPAFSHTLVQPGSASTESDLGAVRLPSLMNATTGTVGVVLSEQCVKMIVWPNQIIHNTQREDVTFIGFQIWVLGMSIVAILNESIPHTLAALATHVLATAWSGYQLVNTASFQSEFVRSTIKSGLCGSVNLLPSYWVERRAAEVTVLVVNVVSLLISAALSWRLVKMFGWQTFKRIGASLEINRVYKIVLTFSIGLQVAFFFIIAAVALWLDILFSTILGANAENVVVYKTFGILTALLMVPWLGLGWFSVRRETQKLMCTFLAGCLLLLISWTFLFLSSTFRWEITEWRFFATMTGVSIALLVLTTLFGVICFYNFDKGLKRFLGTMDGTSDDRDEFTQIVSRDMEKADIVVDFPVSGPIPTYAVAFGNTTKSQSQYPIDRSNSLRSLESTSSSSLGSPLHDPVFFDPAPDYPHLQFSTNTLPPRFRSQENSSVEFSGSSTNAGGASVDRNDSTTSTDSGGNPFSLDLERRHSNGSSASGSTYRSNKSGGGGGVKTYAKPGSNFAPTIMSKHVREDSVATTSSATMGKRWVID